MSGAEKGRAEEKPERSAAQEYTVAVPVAGKRYYGLSRNASYQAAKKGEIPTVRIGGRLRVPVALIERKLTQT